MIHKWDGDIKSLITLRSSFPQLYQITQRRKRVARLEEVEKVQIRELKAEARNLIAKYRQS